MIPSTDIRRAIQTALGTRPFRRDRVSDQDTSHPPVFADPPRDPDWAVREIVDDVMFETAQ